MIRNYQNNVVIDLNLDPIYQSLNSIKNVIADVESLTTLSSLNSLSSFTSLSSFDSAITNLSTGLSSLNFSFATFTNEFYTEFLPSISSNSSNIESLSSSLLSLQSSLTGLTSLSDLATLSSLSSLSGFGNSLTQISQSFGEALSILSSSVLVINSSLALLQQSCSQITNSLITITGGGGGIYTDSTYNPQAFSTTLSLNSEMFYTGNFDLPAGSVDGHIPDSYLFGNWDLRQIKRNDLFSVSVYSLDNLKMDNFEMYSCFLQPLKNCQFDNCGFVGCSIASPIMLNLNACDELFGGYYSGISNAQFNCKDIQHNMFKNVNFGDIDCFNFKNNTILKSITDSTELIVKYAGFSLSANEIYDNSIQDINAATINCISFTANTFKNSTDAKDATICLNAETIQENELTSFNDGEVVGNLFKNNTLASFNSFNFIGSGLSSNTFSNISCCKLDNQNNVFNEFNKINSLSILNCDNLISNTFNTCSCITFEGVGGFDKPGGFSKCTFNDVYYQILFKDVKFSTNMTLSVVGYFDRVDKDYTCTLIFDDCYYKSQNKYLTSTNLFTSLFTTLHSGAHLEFKFK